MLEGEDQDEAYQMQDVKEGETTVSIQDRTPKAHDIHPWCEGGRGGKRGERQERRGGEGGVLNVHELSS